MAGRKFIILYVVRTSDVPSGKACRFQTDARTFYGTALYGKRLVLVGLQFQKSDGQPSSASSVIHQITSDHPIDRH